MINSKQSLSFSRHSFIHAYDFPALHAYPAIAQEIRRVGKYHIELETELFQQFDAVAVEEGEGVVGRFEIREYFIMRNIFGIQKNIKNKSSMAKDHYITSVIKKDHFNI